MDCSINLYAFGGRAFLGSVSDYCAHHAKAPTLIVRPPEENHKKL